MSNTTKAPMFEIFYANDGADRAICATMDVLDTITIGRTKVVNGWAVTRWNDEEYEAGTWGKPNRMMGKESMAEALVSSTNQDAA